MTAQKNPMAVFFVFSFKADEKQNDNQQNICLNVTGINRLPVLM